MTATETKVVAAEEQLNAIAHAIEGISEAVKKMRTGKLNDRALVLLIADASGVSKRDVSLVLDGMEGLKQRFRRKNARGEYL